MDSVSVLGSLGGILTTVSFVPQVMRVYKTGETASISGFMFLIFTIGVGFWLGFGIVLNETSVIIANMVTLVLSFYILSVKIQNSISKGEKF